MNTKILIAVFLIGIGVAFGGDDKDKPVPTAAPDPYNFSDLINKAERIVLGEIGEKKDGVVAIKVLETLKAPTPPRESKPIPADAYKRAEELLKTGTSTVAPQLPPAAPHADDTLNVVAPSDKLFPPQGVQAVFFLWDALPHAEGKPPVYRINHPQCIYDSKVLTQVRAALLAPRTVADGRFLRAQDLRAAARAAQRKQDDELKKIAGGETVLGLTLEAVRPKLMLRGDNSFQIASHIVNTFSKEISVYDGPAGAYGIIIRAKDAPPESALVLRLNKYDDEADPASLNITSITDFEGVPGNNLFTREHLVDSKKFPALKKLAGDYALKMFYINTKDGVKDGLNAPAWTGTMVSKEIPFAFNKVEEKAEK